MKLILKALVRMYRYALSPLMSPCCIYYPSCSAYAEEALETHGWRRGLILSIRRLLRCHPLARGGFDPVPAAEESRTGKHFATKHFKEQV